MRKLLTVLGGLTLAAVILSGMAWLLFYPKGDQLDRESKAYVDATLPLIFRSWDSRAYLEQASPELLAVAPSERIQPMFAALSARLGRLKECAGSKGEATIHVSLKSWPVVTAEYLVDAYFEKAPARISVRAIRRGGQWKLLKLHLDSPALAIPPS